jgi:hypothetical protein
LQPSKPNLAICQCWPSVIPTWISRVIESNWCKINFIGFITQRNINASNFSQRWYHMREIWYFKDDNWIIPANWFCEEMSPNYVPKHLNQHPSFFYCNLAPLSQSLKISCKAIFFLGKLLLKYLNVNCLLKRGLFCKIETRVSLDIKRMRE